MKYFIISIDTEADWFHKERNEIRCVHGLPRLQELCAKWGMIPTYLVTYEMATRDEAVGLIKGYLDAGLCEVGHHLHVWSTPPFERANRYGVDERWIDSIQSELPTEMFENKMQSLHDAIENNYGTAPLSHRAGRWSIDRRTLAWLSQRGYLVDTSICPGVTRVTVKGAVQCVPTDSYHSPNRPYYPKVDDITRCARETENSFQTLEVPVTCSYRRSPFRLVDAGLEWARRVLSTRGFYLMNHRSFRPSYNNMDLGSFEKLTRSVFESDIPFVNFMFHSSELTLGTSPYSRDEESLRRVWRKIDLVMKTAREYGVEGIPLSAVPDRLH